MLVTGQHWKSKMKHFDNNLSEAVLDLSVQSLQERYREDEVAERGGQELEVAERQSHLQ